MPSPSFRSTSTGTLKERSSRKSTVSWAPDGFRRTSSALPRETKTGKYHLQDQTAEQLFSRTGVGVTWERCGCAAHGQTEMNRSSPDGLHPWTLPPHRTVGESHAAFALWWKEGTLTYTGASRHPDRKTLTSSGTYDHAGEKRCEASKGSPTDGYSLTDGPCVI